MAIPNVTTLTPPDWENDKNKDDDFKKHGRHDDHNSNKHACHDDNCGSSPYGKSGDSCDGNGGDGYASTSHNADMTDLHGVLASMPVAQAIDFAIEYLGSTEGFDVASLGAADTVQTDDLT